MKNKRTAANGFSLVEVVVAMVVLTVGMLALATVSGFVTKQIRAADLRTERMVAVQEVVERVRATPWVQLTDGSGQYGRYAVSWRVTDVHTSLRRVGITSVGPAMRAGKVVMDAPETLQISVLRP